jgi:predicted ATPase
VLYERVSASRRVVLHRRIGERGEAVYGERAGEIAAELAMHFEKAANHPKAARYLQQAAGNAMLRSAYREAIALCRHALELLHAVPDSPDRTRLELWLRLTLGVPLIATEGYAAASVGREYERAKALCDRLETTPEMPQVLWGLWTFRALKGELSKALALATELLVLGERSPYPEMAMRGHWAMEITCTHRGEFALALEHFERAMALYTPERLCDDRVFDALNPGVALRCFAAWSHWFTGQPDRALTRIEEAVALARELSEPHGLAHALTFAAVLHQLRREPALAQQYAGMASELSAEHGLVLYQAMATLIRGWTLIGEGRLAAVAEMREGLSAWETTGAHLMRPHFLALLSEGLSGSTDNAAAVAVLDDALEHARRTGECWYLAELHRLKGAALLAGASDESGLAAARACFEEALRIAAAQGAQSLELRAALSLAHLHRASGRPELGYTLLHPIVQRFTEGFDTADVRDARALLGAYTAR